MSLREAELTEFGSGQDDHRETTDPLPEEPPASLLDGFVPPVKERTPIAPDHTACDVKTGDLLVIYVGDEALLYYGFLILSAYADKLVGINLHNRNYGVRELEKWLEWYEEYQDAGAFEAGEKRIYSDVAPVGQLVGKEATPVEA